MGHPKKQRRKYRKPRKQYDKARIEAEANVVKRYGLKNKKELWRTNAQAARNGAIARDLLSKTNKTSEAHFLAKLVRLGLLQKGGTLEDALKIKVDDLFERRLQTRVHREGLAGSMKQARQLITHCHIAVNGQRLTVPSYYVKIDDKVGFYSGSKVSSETHPMRVRKPKAKKAEESKEVTHTQGARKGGYRGGHNRQGFQGGHNRARAQGGRKPGIRKPEGKKPESKGVSEVAAGDKAGAEIENGGEEK